MWIALDLFKDDNDNRFNIYIQMLKTMNIMIWLSVVLLLFGIEVLYRQPHLY